MMSIDPHRSASRAMDAHFAGRIGPADEAALRAHLPDCAPCRARYDRHALLARLTPGAPGASRRLARGLGLPTERSAPGWWLPRRWPRSLPRAWKLALPATALAVAVTVVVSLAPLRGQLGGTRQGDSSRDGTAGFVARGTASAQPALWIYRVAAGDRPQAVGRALHADDELAFAYSNPTDAAFAMVFAVDEHRHVYWFHPGWGPGESAPRAVSVRAGVGPYELPAATRHRLDGTRLVIYGWFAGEATDVTTVERAVQTASRFDALVAPPGTHLVQVPVEVTR
jgi:hypothetical protein